MPPIIGRLVTALHLVAVKCFKPRIKMHKNASLIELKKVQQAISLAYTYQVQAVGYNCGL